MILFLLVYFSWGDVIGEKTGQVLTLSGTGSISSALIGLYAPSSLTSVLVQFGPSEIASDCFGACTALKSISLSNSILYIRSGAFRNTKISELTIPESVVSINANYLFYLSSTLKSITVSSNNQYYSHYKDCLYNSDKTRLVLIPNGKTSVELYDGVITLGSWSMYLLSAITINVPDSVEYLETQSAVDTRGLYHLYFSPKSNLKAMPEKAVYLTGIFNFTCPANVTELGVSCFYQNNNLQFFNYYPGSKLEVVSNTAFVDCASLVSVSLPPTVKLISSTAFSGCISLKYVNIDSPFFKSVNGVVYNENYTSIIFVPSAVTEFNISSKLETISQSSLQRCTDLTIIECDPYNKHLLAYKGIVYNKKTCEALYAAGGLVDALIIKNTTALGSSLFSGMKKLQTCSFEGNSICTVIKENCFRESSIESVSFAPTITQFDSRSFQSCSNLRSVTLPRDLKYVGIYSFSGCSALKSVTFLDSCSLLKITSHGFSGCTSLTILELPDSVTQIQSSAFARTNISSLKLPRNLAELQSSSFSECKNLVRVTADTGCVLKAIASKCFSMCIKLESIQINPSLMSIEGEAFSGCTSLRTIKYLGSPSLCSIASEAFKECSSLPSFNVTSLITSFSPSSFAGCKSLQNYNVDSNSALKSVDGIIFSNDERTIVAFPPGKRRGSIKSGTYKIGAEAFYGCSVLEVLEFDDPSNVDTIGCFSFSGCSSLNFLRIPSSVSLIEENAFQSCTELSTIIFASGSKLEILKSTVFRGCLKISQVRFEDGSHLREIEESALAGFPIASFAIPPKVTSLGSGCFQDCTKLEKVAIDINSSIATVPKDCFSGCSKLSSFNFTSKINRIDVAAFKGCNFDSIELGSGVEEIMESAFENNERLVYVKLSDNLGTLGRNSFHNCGQSMEIFFCGFSHFIEDAFGTNLLPSKSIMVYTMNTYQFDSVCGQPVQRVMRSCGLLPTALFTNGAGRNPQLLFASLISSFKGDESE